jgi:hypothetical protein
MDSMGPQHTVGRPTTIWCEGRARAGGVLKEENWNHLELQNENAGPTRMEIGVITRGERRRKSQPILRISIKCSYIFLYGIQLKTKSSSALHALFNN